MQGFIRRDGPSEEEVANFSGGLASTAEYRYKFEHKKDLANHVWAVALHSPERKISVDDEGRPLELPWSLEAVLEASGNAMARGKRLWGDKLAQKQGRFDRLDSHYGFARYLLVPHAVNKAAADNWRQSIGGIQQLYSPDNTAQIRVERIKVMPQGEMVAMFAPAEAILFDKPFQPLCKGREHVKEGKAAAQTEAELLDLFSAAGEKVKEHNIVMPVPVPDLSTLTPPSIRRTSLRSAQVKSFRPGVVKEYGQLAATLREPVTSTSVSKAQKAMNRLSFPVMGKTVASAKKHFYHTLIGEHSRSRLLEPSFDENGTLHANKERVLGGVQTAVVPPTTPGQAALAAQQTLLLASRVNRG